MMMLIIAGESVFLLPFVLVRIFRPTLLDVFGINNLQLGSAFSVYGIIAMFAYIFGGPLADRYSSRSLMTIALITTAAGGILLASAPSFAMLVILYGFWGLTTVYLFWAALIRATREWGGASSQCRAYGLLDGGRGLVAALTSTLPVAVFAFLLPAEVPQATLAEKASALNRIIWLYTGIMLVTAVFVWILIPKSPTLNLNSSAKNPFAGFRKVMKYPAIWLQAIIVICAYVGYKGTDDFSLYARDAFGYDDVEAARIAPKLPAPSS